MRVLYYKREKCKYDFIVVSDNEELLKIYERMYSCDSFLLTAEKPDLHKIRKKFTALYAKDICCIYCPQNTSTAFSLLPWETELQKIELRDTNALQIIENLMYLTLVPEDGILTLHGAAVAKDDKAFILSASTTAGKSTLAAFLWMRGYEYITDDEIYISQKTLCIEPVFKKLSLRPGGYEILREVFGNPFSEMHYIESETIRRYLLPTEQNTRYAHYKINAVIFLEGYGSQTPYLKKLNTYSGFQKLLKGQLSAADDKQIPAKYKTLAQLPDKTYEMRYSDLWTAETYLEHLQT